MRKIAGLVLCLVASAVFAGEPKNLNPIGSIGKFRQILADNKEVVLFEHKGKGCLTHFWFGGNFGGVENTRIRYYVDGEEKPSIDMDLYMGHGIGFNDNHAPWACKYMGKLGKQNGIFNNYKIPFGKSVKVTAQKAAKSDPNPAIWWIIRGVENGRVTLGGTELPEKARLKLVRNEDIEIEPRKEFDLFDVPGKGAVFQVAIAAKGLAGGGNITYLEACIRAYLAGSKEPVMLSSGLEDYFLGTYYFDTGRYCNDMAGLTHMNQGNSTFSAYRIHDEDPLFFSKGMRMTCRNWETVDGGKDGPPAYGSPQKVRYTTYSWIYQW